jgi:excisionase family DNA binding protein
MEALDPGTTGRSPASKNDVEPLAISPRQACRLLGIGNTRLYELIAAGELVSYHEGRARRITMASIRARHARQLGASARNDTKPQPRRRGRPRKQTAIEART